MAILRRHYRGCYRVSLPDGRFGQIKKIAAREWAAEIRRTQDGALLCYAGIWNTRRDALEQVLHMTK